MISLILAATPSGVIGNNNALPWPKIKADMKWFREKTSGHGVLMGHNTWKSLGEYAPLKGRTNFIVANGWPQYEGAIVLRDVTDITIRNQIRYRLTADQDLFIIGGKTIYEQTAHLADRVYLTTVMDEYTGNTSLDIDALLENMTEISSEENFIDRVVFRIFERKRHG